MIDSHCHLADTQFDADLDDVIQRAANVGVDRIITIADSLSEGVKCMQLCEQYDQLFCAIGVHPHHAKDWKKGDDNKLRAMCASSPNVKAIGEIGLDYHYDFSPRDIQQKVFADQLMIAKDLSLPAVIHCREAVADLVKIIADASLSQLVLHCCTEKWDDVKELVERGYFLSFTGIATYPNADDVRETIRQCPLEQVMIETDAPYLAPTPHRGKRNEPAFVVEVAKKIAEIKGISLEEVDRVTTRNAVQFFSLRP